MPSDRHFIDKIIHKVVEPTTSHNEYVLENSKVKRFLQRNMHYQLFLYWTLEVIVFYYVCDHKNTDGKNNAFLFFDVLIKLRNTNHIPINNN